MLSTLGYTVLAAAMPTEALRLSAAQTGPLQLLITDMVMPEMTGPDLAHHLRQRYPDLKCLFISGYASDDISHQRVYAEGTYYLQKPFVMNDLAFKIKTILDS
jgi:CheY-like chemotaxis protein